MSKAMRQRENITAAICKYVNSGRNLQPARRWGLQPNMRRCGRGLGNIYPTPLLSSEPLVVARPARRCSKLSPRQFESMSYILKCFGLICDIYFEIFLRQNALNVRIGYHVSFGFVLSRDMVKVRSTKGQHSRNPCNGRVTLVLWVVFDVEIYHDFFGTSRQFYGLR